MEMARASYFQLDVDFYEQVYPMLSNFSHSSIEGLLEYFEEEKCFLLHKDDNAFMGLLWISIVNAVLLDELSNIDHIDKTAKRDLKYISVRLKEHILALDEVCDNKQSQILETAVARIKLIGTRRS
jgi:hypothetical protein